MAGLLLLCFVHDYFNPSTGHPGFTDGAPNLRKIAKALASMPDETVLDGAVVALDSGKLSFNALQNYGSSKTPLLYCVFDVLILAGMMAKDVEKGIEGQVTESSVTVDA